MARYFFDVSDPVRVADRVGMNLENLAQVRHEGLRRAAEFASDVENLEEPGAIIVAVRDNEGEAVMTIKLVCSVEVPRRKLGAFAP